MTKTTSDPDTTATTVHALYQAFANGDRKTLAHQIAEEATLHIPGRSGIAGDYQGPAAILGFLGKLAELSGGTFQFCPESFLTGGARAAVVGNATGSRNGNDLDITAIHLITLKEEKVSDVQIFHDDQHAVDEFWS